MQALLILSDIDASTLHMNWLSLRNNQLKFQNFRRTTDRLKRIQRIFLKLIKENWKMLTCNQFGLGNTRIWPIMPHQKISPDTATPRPPWFAPEFFWNNVKGGEVLFPWAVSENPVHATRGSLCGATANEASESVRSPRHRRHGIRGWANQASYSMGLVQLTG